MLYNDTSLRLLIGVDTGWEQPPAGSDLTPWQEPPEAGSDLAQRQEPPEAGSEPPEAGSVLPVAAVARVLGPAAGVQMLQKEQFDAQGIPREEESSKWGGESLWMPKGFWQHSD